MTAQQKGLAEAVGLSVFLLGYQRPENVRSWRLLDAFSSDSLHVTCTHCVVLAVKLGKRTFSNWQDEDTSVIDKDQVCEGTHSVRRSGEQPPTPLEP